MVSSVVMNAVELAEFLEAAEEGLGDPASSVCLILARWCEGPCIAPDIIARWDGNAVQLQIVQQRGEPASFSLRISEEGPGIEGATLQAFGARKFTGGAWALEPSLNLPGVLHGFIVITGVPDPPPWKQRIILATADVIRAVSRRPLR